VPQGVGHLTLHRLVYGSSGIMLGESSDVEALQAAADKLNKQAPQYNHRVVPSPVKKAEK
jgi:phosphoribosylcarboxyaminoimidazole (NCAIR) mutase